MKKSLRISTLALALALIMSVAGCDSGSSASPNPQAPSTQTAEGGGDATAPVASADSSDVLPVTLFYVSPHKETPDTDVIKEYLLETFGIELIGTFASDNWQQKYSLLISSADVPTLSVMPIANFYEYAREGAYMDLTDLVGNYPGIMEYVEDLWPRLSVDGAVYGLPNKNVAGKYNVVYRKDWLDKLGLKTPETIDEYVEVLRAFTEDDPDGNGLDDTYGYANASGSSPGAGMHMFYGMFGGAPGFYHKTNDVIEIGSISEGYKKSLMFVKDLLDKKYMDPESLTQKSDQFWQKFLRGEFGSYVGWWGDLAFPYLAYNMSETQPEAELVTANPVKGPDGLSGMTEYDPLAVVCGISYKAEEVDRILKFIEWSMGDEGYRILKYGTKGLYYDTDENGELTHYWMNDPDHKRLDGVVVEGVTEIFSIFQRLDIYRESLMGDTIDKKLSLLAFDQSVVNPLLRNEFLGITTQEFQVKMPDLTKYEDEMRVKFILGDESFDNWDSYAREYIRLGGIEVAESLLVEYNKMYGENAKLASY
ncbi:MAG: extracellular solute-binding protein [Clostridiales bacterium]|nr:extracellular solute-binding protein [Clostridiales bacterium]